MSLRVPNNPLGRAVISSIEHLQANYAEKEFGFSDLPAIPSDLVVEASGLFGSNAGLEMAQSSVLTALKDAGLIKSTGPKKFTLTDNGRTAFIVFK